MTISVEAPAARKAGETMKTQEENLKYFIENQEELVREYNGKYIVLRDAKVEAAFDKPYDAFRFAMEKYEIGTFSIQKVEPGKDAYTEVFHSRVRLTA